MLRTVTHLKPMTLTGTVILFKYEIAIPKGTTSITLPDNKKIKVFAVTVANNKNEDVTPLQLLYDDFSNDKPVQLRTREYVTAGMQPLKYTQKPLYSLMPDSRQMSRIKAYLKNIGADTVVIPTPPSVSRLC